MTGKVMTVLWETARVLGIEVMEFQLPQYPQPPVRGLYTRYKNRDIILLNQDDSLGEKTFTLAHEMGHFVLHRHELSNRHLRTTYWSCNEYQVKKEIEADHFAWKLLALIYKEIRHWERSQRHYRRTLNIIAFPHHIAYFKSLMRGRFFC